MIWTIAMFGGLLFGVATLIRILMAFGAFCMDDDGGAAAKVREAKRAWLASLTPEDRAAYFLHEKRKKQYVKLREKLYWEVRKRRKAGFDATGVDPDLKAANEVWREWKMDEWDDINLAPDCPWGLRESDGGVMGLEYKPLPAWTPPKWR